jgi:NADH-quinone oxidoreductase subunit J
MESFLFLFFAALTLLGALGVVTSLGVVTGVMSMIVSFVGVAGLFLMLEAFLLAILQVFVYAGAVMVLFLFVVMLLNIEETKRPKSNWLFLGTTIAVAFGLTGMWMFLPQSSGAEALNLPLTPALPLPVCSQAMGFFTSAKAFGAFMFTKYLLEVQIAGVMLLMAVVGAVYLTKSNEDKSV